MGLFTEFKEFALRGNVFDMAVGVVIGAAFGKIVQSFVADVMMPPLGKLLGNLDFSKVAYVMGPGADGMPIEWRYGAFLTQVIDFAIVAMALFLVVKGANMLRRKQIEASPDPAPPPQEVLLTEIRDLLKARA